MDPSATMQQSIQQLEGMRQGARRRRLILLEANAAQHGIELPQDLREELQATYAEAESTGGDEMDLDLDSARVDPSTSSPSIEYIMEETEAAEAPSSHTGVREFQTDPSMSEAPAKGPAMVLMKPTPKIKSKEKAKAERPVRNLLPDHVDQSTMGVDPREPSGPTPASSAPTRRGKRRWASTGWMTWIARRFGGAWTAQASGASDPPDTPVTLFCLLCQKYVTEAHLMSEPHEANMQGFTQTISKEGLHVTQNPVDWATWEQALAEPEQLELGVTEGKARSVVALGPSEFPQPNPKETTAAAPASPGPGPSTMVVEIDESDEDWGEWRPTTGVPAPTTPAHPEHPPISMTQPPGEPVSPTAEHRRGPEPRHAKSTLRVTPPWRESLSNLGYHGPYLQLHLSTPGHTSEGLQALGPLRESFLRTQVKDHAQLPVSLTPPKATSDLSSTVMRMAETMETGEAGTLVPAGRPFSPMSLRAQLEAGVLTGQQYEDRRRARSQDIQAARSVAPRLALPIPPPPPVPRPERTPETPIPWSGAPSPAFMELIRRRRDRQERDRSRSPSP